MLLVIFLHELSRKGPRDDAEVRSGKFTVGTNDKLRFKTALGECLEWNSSKSYIGQSASKLQHTLQINELPLKKKGKDVLCLSEPLKARLNVVDPFNLFVLKESTLRLLAQLGMPMGFLPLLWNLAAACCIVSRVSGSK